ncbi:MAG: ABC transporter substrate-binding protein [Thermomicrobiales bacterium]
MSDLHHDDTLTSSQPGEPAASPSTLSRRRLARNAGMIAGGLAVAGTISPIAAHEASPEASPAASPGAAVTPDPNATFSTVSRSRADVLADLKAAYPFEDPQSTGGDLVQVHTGDIKTLNPVLRTDIASSYITGLLFESLVNVSVLEGELVPGLADSWEVSSDGLRVRFHLNPNATWHDGKPVTPEDVLYSFDAVLAEDGLSPNQTDIVRILADYQKIDDTTVEVTATGPVATFIYQVGTLAIVPKHVWEEVPFSEWGSAPGSTAQDPAKVIGSGAFKFVEWVQEDHVIVARNDDYWQTDQVPVIDRYIYRVVADASASLQTIETGESDLIVISPAQAPAFIKANPDIQVSEYPRSHMTYYITNLDESKTTIFSDVRVRQAFMFAIDRDLIVEQIWSNYAVRADGPQPPLSPAYAPDEITSIYDFDPEKAVSLLDEAGWIAGNDGIRVKDGVKLSFEFLYDDPSTANQQLIPYLQQAWSDIGIEILPAATPVPALIDAYASGNYIAGMLGFEFGIDGNQGSMYRCDSTFPSGFNFSGYCNPEYDELDAKQLAELDPEKRRALLIEQSNILAADLPNGPLLFGKGVAAALPRVHNFFNAQFSSIWSINWIWIDQNS